MTDVEKIKSRLDIVDIISDYVELKPAGVNMKAPCPFHGEKTPSFMVHRERQMFHCFGCSEGGDMFTFVQKMENIEFPEALRILAEKAGITLSKRDENTENTKTRIKDILSLATAFYEKQLWADVGKPARNYLMNTRGISKETIKEFRIGFVPAGWDHLSKFIAGRGYLNTDIAQSGMVMKKSHGTGYYDRFRERIMFPIMNSYGEVIAFTGRLLPEQEKNEKAGGKYINSPETPVFHKSSVLYGLNIAKNAFKITKSAIIVEGQMDVVAAYQAGTRNVVAASGTALTKEHFAVIKRHVDKILFALDSDKAGMTALKRGVYLAWQHSVPTYVITLPDGVKDPGDYAIKQPDEWVTAVSNPMSAISFFIERAMSENDVNTTEGKRAIAQEILPLIKAYPDPIERAEYVRTISDTLGVDELYISEALAKIKSNQDILQKSTSKINTTAPSNSSNSEIDRSLELLLTLAITFPEHAPSIIKDTEAEFYANSSYESLYNALEIWYNDTNLLGTPFEANKDGDLIHLITHLELLGNREYGDITTQEALHEYQRIMKLYRTSHIRRQLKSIEQQLKSAEQQSVSKETVSALIKKLDTLTKQLRELMA